MPAESGPPTSFRSTESSPRTPSPAATRFAPISGTYKSAHSPVSAFRFVTSYPPTPTRPPTAGSLDFLPPQSRHRTGGPSPGASSPPAHPACPAARPRPPSPRTSSPPLPPSAPGKHPPALRESRISSVVWPLVLDQLARVPDQGRVIVFPPQPQLGFECLHPRIRTTVAEQNRVVRLELTKEFVATG